jgi:serine/threonine protein kinase
LSNHEDPGLTDLVEEFAARVQAGEAMDPDAFARAHPSYEGRLRRLLPAVQALADLGRTGGGPKLYFTERKLSHLPLLGRLGDFRLLRELGRGGMGIVYEAEQISLGRRIALKVLPSAAALDGKNLQRFKNEAQAAALLQHPNIVPVIAVGCEEGTHYFAMQLIEGKSLATHIKELRLVEGISNPTTSEAVDLDRTKDLPQVREGAPPSGSGPTAWAHFREAARLVLQAAEALEHAHLVGVIHRDIKPANLLLDGRGNLWVTDFGLARLQNDAGLTASGDLLGTIRYMSPEQAQARRTPVDHRTDVYGLGATLYELATLQPAFPGDDRRDLLRRIASEEPRRPRRVNTAVPADLEAVVLKAMEKCPAERYATAHELADDLRRFLDDKPVRASRPTVLRSARKWASRHSALLATASGAAAIVLVVLATALTLLSVSYQRLRDQETRLREQDAKLNEDLVNSRQQEANLHNEQAETQKALDTARTNAVRAKGNARLVLAALKEMTLQLRDEQLARDPYWGRKAKDLVERALRVYELLARSEQEDPEVREAVAGAFRQAGSVYGRLGQLELARAAYQRATEMAEGLITTFPIAYWYRILASQTYRELGSLCASVGQRKEAAKAYRQAISVWDRTSPLLPCPLEGALAHIGLAQVCEQEGQPQEAAEHYRKAIALRARLAVANGQDHGYRGELAYWHRSLGWLLERQGERPSAEWHFKHSRDMFDRLCNDLPGNGDYKLELANCCGALGAVREEDAPQEAHKFYLRANELLSPLAEQFPGVPVFRQLLAEFHCRLGGLAWAAGKRTEAANQYREAQRLLVALAAEVRKGEPGPGAPGANENFFARFLASCPDKDFRDPHHAVELAHKAVNRASQRGDYWTTLGAALYRAGDMNAAIEALEKAVKLHQGGDVPELMFLALAHAKRGEDNKARDYHERALALEKRYKSPDLSLRLLRDEVATQLSRGSDPSSHPRAQAPSPR